MCGITAIFKPKDPTKARDRALKMSRTIRHRGPDETGIYSDSFATLVHERLAIVDPEHGMQPIIDQKTGRVIIENGEIYSYKELRKLLKKDHSFQSDSDAEVLLYLYDEYGPEFIKQIDGMFAIVLYDPTTKEYYVARDHIGIIPLYIGWDADGTIHIASEMKALEHCKTFQEFPSGHYYQDGKFTKWYDPQWIEGQSDPSELRERFEHAVTEQLHSDVPLGVLLSGGLDSSIVASIAARKVPGIHSFAIGLQGSPDLEHARKVAIALKTKHHELIYTIQEGVDAIRDVIYHLETYDVTTIRAATPMYLMARKIKSLGIKVVLSGEGADEIFGGYLYFHMAPDKEEFQAELKRKLSMLSKYDCLRANKSMAAWGVETRVPFLSKKFLDYAMRIDPKEKLCTKRIEKHLLREAFTGCLPDEILWRQKEQFSDGVGYSWIDTLKQLAQEQVTDEMMTRAHKRFPIHTPLTKEEYRYREIFEELFTSESAAKTVPTGPTIACSTPTAHRWSEQFKQSEPSGRAIRVHAMTTD